MRVFVAGATGDIGRPLVDRLVQRGHAVWGMTRSAQRGESVRAAGATPVICDAFDAEGLRTAVGEVAPEVVVHQLTSLPKEYDMRNYRKLVAPTNRLRTEGTRNLLAAAKAAGAGRIVAQSVAFMYDPSGGWIKDEEAPLMRDPDPALREAVEAMAFNEGAVLEIGGLVLRYGFFYGPGSYFGAGGSIAEQVRGRKFPIVGRGTGMFSFVHSDDAAAATVAAVEGGPPGIYNVCDDEPAPVREWLPVFARAIGAKRPLRAPKLLARLVAGSAAVDSSLTARGASNAKAKRELHWTPRYATWREGFRTGLA